MSDRFDAELKRALKESTAKSLEGWEFTPAMRQAVLKRIAEEGSSEPAPVAPPRERRRAMTARPLVWVAAAAAALVVSLNMSGLMDSMGARKSQESAMQAPKAASAVPEAKSLDQKAESAVSTSAGGSDRAGTDEAGVDAAQVQMATAPPTGQGESLATGAAAPAPPNPARILLVAPEAAPAETTDKEAGMAAGIAAAKVGPMLLTMAPLPEGEAVVLTTEALHRVDRSGVVVWEQRVENPGLLAAGPGGRLAVTAGERLLLFTAEGQPTGTVQLPGWPSALTFSPDGRLAVVAAGTLLIYDGTELQLKAPDLLDPSVAFAPDGRLAVLARESSGGRFLHLLSREGRQLARSPVAAEGAGITFAAEGRLIVAGGEAFDLAGRSLWRAPFAPLAISTLGPGGPVVVWNEHQVSLLRPEDGVELWTAEQTGGLVIRVAVSPTGDQLAILGGLSEGAAIWVLDRTGGQRQLTTLPIIPADLAVQGDSLRLLMPDGLQTLKIGE
ncbi:MAG: hypothetical protein ACOY93_11400 [Bacillota bacterium]